MHCPHEFLSFVPTGQPGSPSGTSVPRPGWHQSVLGGRLRAGLAGGCLVALQLISSSSTPPPSQASASSIPGRHTRGKIYEIPHLPEARRRGVSAGALLVGWGGSLPSLPT